LSFLVSGDLAAMPVTKALAILAEGLAAATDSDCYHALCRALKSVDPALAA